MLEIDSIHYNKLVILLSKNDHKLRPFLIICQEIICSRICISQKHSTQSVSMQERGL